MQSIHKRRWAALCKLNFIVLANRLSEQYSTFRQANKLNCTVIDLAPQRS